MYCSANSLPGSSTNQVYISPCRAIYWSIKNLALNRSILWLHIQIPHEESFQSRYQHAWSNFSRLRKVDDNTSQQFSSACCRLIIVQNMLRKLSCWLSLQCCQLILSKCLANPWFWLVKSPESGVILTILAYIYMSLNFTQFFSIIFHIKIHISLILAFKPPRFWGLL